MSAACPRPQLPCTHDRRRRCAPGTPAGSERSSWKSFGRKVSADYIADAGAIPKICGLPAFELCSEELSVTARKRKLIGLSDETRPLRPANAAPTSRSFFMSTTQTVTAAPANQSILFAVDGPVAVVTLNRPKRRNALSLELMTELIGCLNVIAGNRDVRAVILRAAGKAFCSGHDLGEMVGRDINHYRRVFDVCTELMTRMQTIPQPIIAEVQGIATAAGCQLVATCDLAVASDQAAFATPGVKIGLFCTTPMVALSRAVGRKRALQMLLTGEMVDAATAADWGLVNAVVPAAELGEHARKLAERIAEASPLTVALGKQAFYTQVDLDQPKAYAYAKEVMSMNSLAADAQEGISAFLEKRRPCWTGK